MNLTYLRISNFRALKNIELQTRGSPRAIVVAGPNAVGKTTVLEAVRLTKALLSPNFQGEQELTLRDMGIMSPGQNAIDIEQIANNPKLPVEIELRINLSDREVESLAAMLDAWARRRLANRLALQADNLELALLQFLSSQAGNRQFEEIKKEITAEFAELAKVKAINPTLRIQSGIGLQGTKAFDQEVLASLARRSAGYLGLVNYFPADRALPSGDVHIQLGSADFQAQIHSHTAQPATKYARLKQYLVNRFLLGDVQRAELQEDFKIVFEHLLHDKGLDAIRLSETGRLSVSIVDKISEARYDIDRMSSGEKGLLLTLLLMRRTTMPGGILLVDEPELHLNSAVCRDLLPFLVKQILEPADLQAIICTHSEEILASAHSREDCDLFRLRSAEDISRIELQDKEELESTLKALGSSSVDILFSSGTLYVEGTDDRKILEAGFPGRVAKWKILPLRGRQEVEKHIRQLQDAERRKTLDGVHAFIFDQDYNPTKIANTGRIHVLQWDRYCLENYLLDPDAIFDGLQNVPHAPEPVPTRGSLQTLLRDRSMAQIQLLAAQKTYAEMEPENPGLRTHELANLAEVSAMGKLLLARLEKIRDELAKLDGPKWLTQFEAAARATEDKMREEWSVSWLQRANGKTVLDAVHAHFMVRVDRSEFKARIARALFARQAESWKLVDTTLQQALHFSIE